MPAHPATGTSTRLRILASRQRSAGEALVLATQATTAGPSRASV